MHAFNNIFKLGLLMIVFGLSIMIFVKFFDSYFAIAISYLIVLVIYILEKMGVASYFNGMSAVAVAIATSATLMYVARIEGWPAPVAYFSLTLLGLSAVFACVRVLMFNESKARW